MVRAALAAIRQGLETDRLDVNFQETAFPILTRSSPADGCRDIIAIVDTRTEEGLKYLYEGLYAGTAILARPDMLDRNPQTVQAFVDAIVGALHWMDAGSLDEIMAQFPPNITEPMRI